MPAGTESNIFSYFHDFLVTRTEFCHLLDVLPAINIQIDQERVSIVFPYPQFEYFFNQHLRNDFERALTLYLNQNLDFIYLSPETAEKTPISVPSSSKQDTFADFLSTPRNRPILDCARKICSPAQTDLNLVLFYGPSGSGKSLLLSAIKGALIQLYGQKAIHSSRAETFEPQLAPERFWEISTALLLDDLQDIVTDPTRQNLISAFIDCAQERAGLARIVLVFSGRDTDIFTAKLSRRLEQGLRIEFYPADFSLRLLYAEKKARELGMELSRAQLTNIARQQRNISTISGILQKFKFYTNLNNPVTAAEELEKLVVTGSKEPAWHHLLMKVSKKLGLKPDDILGKSRRQDLVLARQTAMFILRMRYGLSYPELGRIFGGRDHATVMHGIKKIQKLRDTDTFMHTLLTELEEDEDQG